MVLKKKKNVLLVFMQPWLGALSRASNLIRYLFYGVCAVALVRDTAANGHDFKVFWWGARTFLDGQPVYSMIRNGGLIFKYPPWTLPFFAPWGWIPLELAHSIWGALQVLSLGYILYWVRSRMDCRGWVVDLVTLSFWGIWVVHALDGQVVMLMLAVVLWAGGAARKDALDQWSIKNFILVFALTTKIHSVFPLLHFRITRGALVRLAGYFGVFLLLALWVGYKEFPSDPFLIFGAWKDAAISSANLLGDDQVRGKYNPGLTGYLLRLLSVPREQVQYDVWISGAFCLAFAAVWHRFSRKLTINEQWIGWLGLAPVVHPLPWWHLYIFSFPLVTVALDRAITMTRETRKWKWVMIAMLGPVLVGMGTERVFGSFGIFLENNAGKSWGVLVSAVLLVVLRSNVTSHGNSVSRPL